MHFLTRSLPRRTVLKGVGATLALPFLEAMLPASTLRAAAKPVRRFQAFYTPNGMAMEYWTPKTEGANFEMTPVLEPLAPYRDQMLVFSGLRASWNYIHAGASGSFLTGTPRGGKTEIEIIADSRDRRHVRHQCLCRQGAPFLDDRMLELDGDVQCVACTAAISHDEQLPTLPESLRHSFTHTSDGRCIFFKTLLLHIDAFANFPQNGLFRAHAIAPMRCRL